MTYNKKSIARIFLLFSALLVGASWQLSAREMVGFVGKSHEASKTASDCQSATAQIELNINNVRTRLLTGGDLWWDLNDGKYEVPKVDPESGEVSRNSLFAGALWIGGIDALGQLKVAAQTYRQSGNDFYPGPLDEAGQTDAATCSDFDQFWKVEASEINTFLQTFESNGGSISAGDVPESILGWPGRNNPYFIEFNTFDLPANQDLAPYWDVLGDDEYDPLTGDYPVIDSKNEGVYADQMIWWVVNDKGNAHTETGGEAIGLEISSLAFAFATNDEVNNMTFYKYIVENNSSTSLDSVFFSQWVDPDLGNFDDDYVGCDTLNDLGIVYNGDGEDDGLTGYGDNLPLLGVDFFKGPNDENGKQLGMSSFLYYNNDFTVSGNPETVNHFYGYMAGVWKDGSPFTFGGNGYGGSEPFNFIFPGDPSDPSGWSECSEGNPPADRRFLQTSGPFRLDPGVINDVIIGVVWVRDGTWSACSSFRTLLNADRKAQALFDNNFSRINGPDAPNMTIRELDQELIMTLWNEESSNNYQEKYAEADPVLASVGLEDSLYTFQGYRIFQLKNSTVTPGDFGNPSLAREIETVDIVDGVGNIINYAEDPIVGVLIPNLEVEGPDQGIKHTFRIVKDEFADGDSKLVNYKRYYYAVIAYAHNDYTPYDPENPGAELNAQQLPYLAGRNNVRVYTAIPHLPGAQFSGQMINANYGDSPQIIQISGVGNGGTGMELTEESVTEILENGFIENPVYESGQGPIEVQIFDPTLVPDRRFRVKVNNSDFYNLPEKSDQGAALSIEDGVIQYNAEDGASYRSDHFNYQITNQFGETEIASVVLNFTGNLIGYEGAYDDTRTIYATPSNAEDPYEIDVLANDDIVNPKNIAHTQPASGVVTYDAEEGVFILDPPNDPTSETYGIFTWTYAVEGDFSGTTQARVTVNIRNSATQDEFRADDDVYDINSGADYSGALAVLDNDTSPLLTNADNRIGTGSSWVLEDADSGDILAVSENNIALPNEQAVGGYELLDGQNPLGFIVNIAQQPSPNQGNGLISAELIFSDNENQWLSTIQDAETTDERNWIRAGSEYISASPTLNDYVQVVIGEVVDGYDLEENYENLLGGGIAPYSLTNNLAGVAREFNATGDEEIQQILQISPGCSDCGGETNKIDEVYSIDLVFTPNKDDWTRCVVVEMGRESANNQGGGEKNGIRQRASIDKEGNSIANDIGRSWFPGYAINVETGERLNIMFGENSFLGNEQGFSRDMAWNPTSQELGTTGTGFADGFGDYIMGLEHWVYVMNSRYDPTNDDGGKRYQELLLDGTSDSKTEVYDEAMWVATTKLAEGFELKSMADGLVPSEATMRIRVKRPYTPEENTESLCYEFDMGDYAVSAATGEDTEGVLDNVKVVPNPYYAFSAYENNKLDNRVKVTNLPPRATVRIFNMSGALIRQLEIDSRGFDTAISSKAQSSASRNEIDWDLKNFKGIPAASGMYLIHIEDPESGEEKVIKWFGVVRPVDLDTF